jgi:hypothetical protein
MIEVIRALKLRKIISVGETIEEKHRLASWAMDNAL